MKTLLIASALFSGSGAVAMQNENVNATVTQTKNTVMTQVRNMFKGSQVSNIKENGFPYPSENYLSTLTEDQVFAITSAIDVINANYDWKNMTDEEIKVTLVEVKAEMSALYQELGVEAPAAKIQTQTRSRKGKNFNEDFIPNSGISQNGLQDGSCNDDEVVTESDDLV